MAVTSSTFFAYRIQHTYTFRQRKKSENDKYSNLELLA